MVYSSPAIVIDNGSYTTKSGFALEDLPSLVFNSNYLFDSSAPEKVIIGDDEICSKPENEIMTLLDNGVIYNFDKIVDNWNYIFENIDNNNSVDPKEFPLMMTEEPWNTSKNRLKTTQIVFENFEVPLFSLVKTPLAQLYHMGQSTGLVIDIGASTTSVTPILDGIIQNKSAFHSKYAGDFLNLQILSFFESKVGFDMLVPKKFQTSSPSFKNYYVSHNVLQDYKISRSKDYILPSGVTVSGELNYMASLFQPNLNKLPNITIPEPVYDKPQTHGLVNLIFSSLKSLETSLVPMIGQGGNTHVRFNEILKNLLSNVLITGGTSLSQGLCERVINDLRALNAQYFPNYGFNPYYIQQINTYQPGDVNEVWDKQFSSWLGACNLAGMLNDNSEDSNGVNIALENWFITKSDYEELGEDLILEKFK